MTIKCCEESLLCQVPFEEGLNAPHHVLADDPSFKNEVAVEGRCSEAFAAVQHFESSHSLTLQAMGLTYLQHRASLVEKLFIYGKKLHLREEVAHDAILLMDRAMSTSIQVKDNLLELLSVACLVLAMRQTEKAEDLPSDEALERVTDCKASAVGKMEWNLQQVLGSDTSAISTLRCVKLYLERLGSRFLDSKSVAEVSGGAAALVERSMSDLTFLNCRPSVVAAAILYAERRSRGVIPFWPSMLAKLTGYQDMSSPELTVAIRGAQKLCQWSSDADTSISGDTALQSLALMAHSGVDVGISAASDPTAFLMSAVSSGDVMATAAQSLNLGLLNLEPSRSFPPYDALGSLNTLVNPQETPLRSQSTEDDKMTGNRVDGIVVAQGVAMPPRVALSHVTSGFPIIPASSALLGSNATSRVNSNAYRVSVNVQPCCECLCVECGGVRWHQCHGCP